MSLENILPTRKLLRLKGFDYSGPGFYFITINCKFLECRFGQVYKGKMILNEFGVIALNEWSNISSRFSNVLLHDFQFMPNHMHGIIEITRDCDAYKRLNITARARASPAHTDATMINELQKEKIDKNGNINLSEIIGAYKSIVYNKCLVLHKEKYNDAVCVPLFGKLWHRSFYDIIIRDKSSFKSISRYIRNNPRK